MDLYKRTVFFVADVQLFWRSCDCVPRLGLQHVFLSPLGVVSMIHISCLSAAGCPHRVARR